MRAGQGVPQRQDETQARQQGDQQVHPPRGFSLPRCEHQILERHDAKDQVHRRAVGKIGGPVHPNGPFICTMAAFSAAAMLTQIR